jgi:LPXTG-motif cell wall-anchored protein
MMEMIFVKKMLSILLVLAFCLSLVCPAFAAVSSPTGSGPRPGILGDTPKTGDVIMFWVAIMAVSVMALGAVYCVYRRKFSK